MPISRSRRARRWRIPLLVAAALLVAVIVARTSGGGHSSPAGAPAKFARTQTSRSSDPPPPFVGRLLIADRGNDRLLLVDAHKKILWRYPSKTRPAPPGGFYFPDDAFFTHGGTPHAAMARLGERWPALRFVLRPRSLD